MPLELARDYFLLFQLPRQRSVDMPSLTRRYRDLQRQFHPDRYAAAGETERRLAAQAAAHVNQAYRTLQDEHACATYLLSLHGVDIDDEKDTSTDAEFLMRQMEWHEKLEELRDVPAMETFDRDLRKEEQMLWQTFDAEYAEEQWPAARETLLKLRFYRRLHNQLQTNRERMEAR